MSEADLAARAEASAVVLAAVALVAAVLVVDFN